MYLKIMFLILVMVLVFFIVMEVCFGIWDLKEVNKIFVYSRNYLFKLSFLNVLSCVIDVFVLK